MPLKTSIQVDIIIYALLSGVLIGGIFDLYRIIRGRNVNKIIVAIEDILFWILIAITVFSFLLYTNYAFLGPYVYIFMILSLFLYLKFISRLFVKIEIAILKALYKFFRIGFKNIIYPIKLILYSLMGKNN